MRIPHFVSKNTQIEYEPSPESLGLFREQNRNIHPENFQFDAEFVPTLVSLCVEVLAKAFEDQPLLDELPCAEREHILELLPTDLPLEMVIPLIQDEIYWQRRFQDEFGQLNQRKHLKWTWKEQYLERYLRKRIEEAQPQYADEDMMEQILELINPYVKKLIVTQLQPWTPPLYYEPEEIPDVWPIQHINFEPIFKKLQNLVEIDITFGLKDIWETYKPTMFKVSVNDIKHLGKAILNQNQLKIFRLHRCAIEDDHAQHLMKSLLENTTLEELDLSHCLIKNRGALCVAKLLTVHPALQILRLTNNQISGEGGIGLGYALMQDTCSPLVNLDLRLNPLGHEGTMGILRALVRVFRLKELNLAATFFEDDTPLRLGQMVGLNKSLKKLDISNNYFDERGFDSLYKGMQSNRTLEWLDMRECDIEDEDMAKINKILLRNRLGIEDEEDDEAIQAEEIELVEAEGEAKGEEDEDDLDKMED